MFATRHNPAQQFDRHRADGRDYLRPITTNVDHGDSPHPLATLLPVTAVIAAIIAALLISAARQPPPALDSYYFGGTPPLSNAPRPLPAYARVADPHFAAAVDGDGAAVAPRSD